MRLSWLVNKHGVQKLNLRVKVPVVSCKNVQAGFSFSFFPLKPNGWAKAVKEKAMDTSQTRTTSSSVGGAANSDVFASCLR